MGCANHTKLVICDHAIDITYLPLQHGFMYLVAVIDWFSRYVLAWQLSNTLDSHFCLDALQLALCQGQPDIFNTDQGAQFISDAFTTCLQQHDIRISMDGRGRALDNIFVERLWRSVKYEDIFLKEYVTVPALAAGLDVYFRFYNHERLHQSLAYRTPAEVHFAWKCLLLLCLLTYFCCFVVLTSGSTIFFPALSPASCW
jgi:putative transposase